jgi:hypothetical protein
MSPHFQQIIQQSQNSRIFRLSLLVFARFYPDNYSQGYLIVYCCWGIRPIPRSGWPPSTWIHRHLGVRKNRIVVGCLELWVVEDLAPMGTYRPLISMTPRDVSNHVLVGDTQYWAFIMTIVAESDGTISNKWSLHSAYIYQWAVFFLFPSWQSWNDFHSLAQAVIWPWLESIQLETWM